MRRVSLLYKLKTWNDGRKARASERAAAELERITREFEQAFDRQDHPAEGCEPSIHCLEVAICVNRLGRLALTEHYQVIPWHNQEARAAYRMAKSAAI